MTDRIAELEAWGRSMCAAVAEAYLSSDPKDLKRGDVFYKVYREARGLGLIEKGKI